MSSHVNKKNPMKPVHESYEQSYLYKVRHSVAHVLAEAVRSFYPQVKLAIGPPIEDGFYYDFDLGRDENGKVITFAPEDVARIEAKVKALLRDEAVFCRSSLPIADALALARAEPPAVVLMDLSLPGVDGIEATRQLKSGIIAS